MDLPWLRNHLSKWLMRTQQAGRVLRLPLYFITALSTTITALKGTVLENHTLMIAAIFGVAAMIFIWAYDRFQVLNIQNRWNSDRSDNFVGPNTAVNQMVNARQLVVLASGIKDGKSKPEIEDEMREATLESLKRYRNGFDMDVIDG